MPLKFSIITVCYNAQDTLESTIKSVLAQSYSSVEYILIDGKSTDNTPKIIQKYKNQCTKWISETDNGIYDAMNKGISMATGDYLWFLNAGDTLPHSDIVAQIATLAAQVPDVLYGETMLVNAHRHAQGTRSELTTRKLPQQLTWKSMRHGLVVCHQAFLVKRSIAPTYLTDNLSADIDWIIRSLKQAQSVIHTQQIMVEYLMGGTSVQHHRQSLIDRYKVLQQHFGVFPNIWNHLYILVRAVWFRVLRLGKKRYE